MIVLGHSRLFMAAVSRATGIFSAVVMVYYTCLAKENVTRFLCMGENDLPVTWASKGRRHLNVAWSHTGTAQNTLRQSKAMRYSIGNLTEPGYVVNLVYGMKSLVVIRKCTQMYNIPFHGQSY